MFPFVLETMFCVVRMVQTDRCCRLIVTFVEMQIHQRFIPQKGVELSLMNVLAFLAILRIQSTNKLDVSLSYFVLSSLSFTDVWISCNAKFAWQGPVIQGSMGRRRLLIWSAGTTIWANLYNAKYMSAYVGRRWLDDKCFVFLPADLRSEERKMKNVEQWLVDDS